MSSLFSDPPFRRGVTLLDGNLIERYPDGVAYSATNNSGAEYPIAGAGVVGQIKVFPDVNPYTGAKLSNELVYCIAARYKPTTDTTLTTPPGKGVVLKVGQYLESASFDENLATSTNVITGERLAFIDEYIPTGTVIRPDDVVWLVFKGPAAVKKTEHASTAAIAAGVVAAMSSTAGSVFTKTVDSIFTLTSTEPTLVGVGLCWGKCSDDFATVTYGVAAASADKYARINLWGQNWA